MTYNKLKPSKRMQSVVTKLADRHGVDLEQTEAHLRLDMPGFEMLCIERIWTNLVSVAHYYEQNGDLVPDPDIVFFTGYDLWIPIRIQTVWWYVSHADLSSDCNEIMNAFNREAQSSLAEFTEMWAKNLEDQGWLEHSILYGSSHHNS